MRRRQGGGAVEGEEVAAAGHDDDPNDGGEELVNPILLLIYGVGLVVPLPDMAERIEVLRAAAGIEMQGEEGDDEGRHGGVRAFNAAARVHRNRIDSTDRRDIECLGNLIFGPMFPTIDPIPVHLLYWMLEVCLDGPHGAHSAVIAQIRGFRGELPILPGDEEWTNAIQVARRPIEAQLAQRYGHQRQGHPLYHQPPRQEGHGAEGGQAQGGAGGRGGGGGGGGRGGGWRGAGHRPHSDSDVDDPRIDPGPISPFFRWAVPVFRAARRTPWLVDVVEIGLACPASLMLWFLLSLVDDKRGYWSMVMVMEIGVLSLPPSFLSWAYTRVVFCQLLFYSAALHMPYWAGDLLTPLQTCYRLLLFVACCATLEVEKHAYALRWPRRRSNRRRDSCYMALDVFISFALSLGPSTCQLLARHQGSGGEPDPENGVQDTNGRYLFWMSLSFLVSGSMILVMVDVLSRWRSYYRAGCDLHSEWCDYIQHTSIPDRAKEIFVGCRIGDAMCAMWMGLFTSYVVLFQSRSASARLAQQDPGVAAEGDGATPAQNLGVICALAAMHCCTGFTDGMVMTQILDRFCTLVSRLLRLLVNGRRDEDPEMTTFASIVLVMMHTNPSRESDVARQLIMLCNFLFIFGGILVRQMGRIACDAVQELAASPLSWRSGNFAMHVRCWIGCMIVIISSIWAVSFSFDTILAGAGMMLALIAVSDYMISTVNTVAGLATYAIGVYHSARGTEWAVVDRHTYIVQVAGKGLQIGVTACAMGWALKEHVMHGEIASLNFALILVLGYSSVWLPWKAGWKEMKQRNAASGLTRSMRAATEAEIAALDDDCPICLSRMQKAIVTKCGHLYHAHCLQRWLLQRSACPKCNEVLVSVGDGADAGHQVDGIDDD